MKFPKTLLLFLALTCAQQQLEVEFFNDSFERVLLFWVDARGAQHFFHDINGEASVHMNVLHGSTFVAYKESDLTLMWRSSPITYAGQHRIWREVRELPARKAVTLTSSGAVRELLRDGGRGAPLERLGSLGPGEEATLALKQGEALLVDDEAGDRVATFTFGEIVNGARLDVSTALVCDDDGCVKPPKAARSLPAAPARFHKSTVGTIQVYVMPNGGNNTGREPVLHVSLNPSEKVQDFVARTAPILQPFVHELPQRDWRNEVNLCDELGERLQNLHSVKQGDFLFVVSKREFFFWPGISVGRRVRLPHVRNGAGQELVLETLTLQPRLFAIDNWVTNEEADAIVAAAQQVGLVKSQVTVDPGKGKHEELSDVRRSEQVFMRTEPPVIKDFKERTFNLTRVPVELYESMQVLHYPPDGEARYNAHADGFSRGQYPSKESVKKGSNRMITVFSYLSTVGVGHGGHTVFPRADITGDGNVYHSANSYGLQPMPHYKDCTKGFLSPAIKGRAVMWYNLMPLGSNDFGAGGAGDKGTGGSAMLDERALHGGCPLTGPDHKYAANFWIGNSGAFFSTTGFDETERAKERYY